MNLHAARYIDRWVGIVLCFVLHVLARLAGHRLPRLGATTPPSHGPLPAPRRVLGMKFYGLGNIVMILPVLRELQIAFPGIEIDFLTLPGNRALLERSGLVRRVLTVDVSSTTAFIASVWQLLRDLRRNEYDAVLDFEQFLKVSGIFAFWTGAPARIGLNTEGQYRAFLYTTRIAYTDADHTTDIFLRVIAPFGITPTGARTTWRLPVLPADREQALALLAAAGAPRDGTLVVMHIGTGPNYKEIAVKRWDHARFAAVADALAQRHHATIVFTGQGPEEQELITEARAMMQQPGIDLCNRLSIGEFSALLAEASFVVTNDTSALHMAGIVGTPVVALFGATSPLLYGPRGPRDLVFSKQLYCSPCLSNYNLKYSRCHDPVCMKQITVDEVLAGIEARFLTAAARSGERA